jgi:phosphoketolase
VTSRSLCTTTIPPSTLAHDRPPIAQGLDRPKTVDGIKNEGTFRSHLVPLIDRLPYLGTAGDYLKQQMKNKLVEHKQYIDQHGQDLPEIRIWKWHN